MKSYYFLFTAMLLITVGLNPMNAQSELGRNPTEVGVRIGGNFGSASVGGLSGSTIDGHSAWTAGLVVRQPLDDKLAITTGIHYKQKGFGIGEMISLNVLDVPIPLGARAVTKLNYIEVPLLLNYTHKSNSQIQPYIEVGPTFGYATSATLNTIATVIININTSSTDLDLSNDRYNRFEIAGQGAAGVKIPYGKGYFDLGLNYTQAFTDSIGDTVLDINLKNRGFGVYAGFSINI